MRSSIAIALGTVLPMIACNSAKRVEEQKVADAFNRFSQCVAGAPLGKDENPRSRLRSIELALLADPAQRTLPPMERWPRRCKGEASAFHSALAGKKQNRRSVDETLQAKLYAVVVALDARSDLDSLGEVLEVTRSAELHASEIPGARRAPEPARPLLEPPEPVPLQYVFGGSAPLTTQPIGLWKSDEKRLCTNPFGKQPLTCKKLDRTIRAPLAAASASDQLWYYDEGKANESRDLVVQSLDGGTRHHPLQKDFVVSAVRVETDALLTLDVNHVAHRFSLSLARDGHAEESIGATFEAHPRGIFETQKPPFLVGDFVVLESKTGIQVRRIQREPLGLAEPETVLGSESVLPLAEGGQLILLGHGSETTKSGVAIYDGARWFSHDADFFTPRAIAASPGRFTLYASGENDSIREVRCDLRACTAQTQKLVIPHRFCGPAFAPLGESALVMWRSDLGDVRMRIGPLAHIDAAEEHVIFDEGPTPDSASESPCIQLISQGERVLAVIQSFREGRIPLLIDASGKVTPVSMNRPSSP